MDLTALLTESTGRVLQVPTLSAAPGKKDALETAWEDHGGSDSKVQSTVRKGNLNITPQSCPMESACLRAQERRDLELPNVNHVMD